MLNELIVSGVSLSVGAYISFSLMQFKAIKREINIIKDAIDSIPSTDEMAKEILHTKLPLSELPSEMQEKINEADIDKFFEKFYVVATMNALKEPLININLITSRIFDLVERTSSLQIAKVSTIRIHIPYKLQISNNGRSQTTLLEVKGNLYSNNNKFYSGEINDLRVVPVKPGEVKEYESEINLSSNSTVPFLKGLLKKAVVKILKIDDDADNFAVRNREDFNEYMDKMLENEFKIINPDISNTDTLKFEVEILDQHKNLSSGNVLIEY